MYYLLCVLQSYFVVLKADCVALQAEVDGFDPWREHKHFVLTVGSFSSLKLVNKMYPAEKNTQYLHKENFGIHFVPTTFYNICILN